MTNSLSRIAGSDLEHVDVGDGCEIVNCVIRGGGPAPEQQAVIGPGAKLFNSTLLMTPVQRSFTCGRWRTASLPLAVGRGAVLANCTVINSRIGDGVNGFHAHVEHSEIGANSDLRRFANVTLSHVAPRCFVGSELSKSIILGEGFTSEHGSSYLSLLAPDEYPVLDEEGRERVLRLPNVTNIGAGTVFANYSGQVLDVSEDPQFEKGTAVIWSGFTCINARIINRYGKIAPGASWFDVLRDRNITALGFGSFVENKVTGRIPAFAYAGDMGPGGTKLGWVLERKPGIVLTFIHNMRLLLGAAAGALEPLIEGTIRLEIALLEEDARDRHPVYPAAQRTAGLAVLRRELASGRWRLDDLGQWTHPWRLEQGKWI